jgi:hypothetical protein
MMIQLNGLEDDLIDICGKDADIFMYGGIKSSMVVIDSKEMTRGYVYMVRFGFVTAEYREANNLIHCTSHGSIGGMY